MKLTISISDSEHELLQAKAKQDLSNVVTVIGQIVGNWCADQRRDKRLKLPSHHYSQRNAEDYSETE